MEENKELILNLRAEVENLKDVYRHVTIYNVYTKKEVRAKIDAPLRSATNAIEKLLKPYKKQHES